MDILELLAASRDGLALKELSMKVEAPKSSLLPLLRTLSARGYLKQARPGEYSLGPKALELGKGSPAHQELLEVARPTLVELMGRTKETVSLATLTSDSAAIVYVDKIESEHLIRFSIGIGHRRPLHATASGKAILAFLPVERREDILRSLTLERYTERTVSTLPALRASLEEIRRTGVSINVDEIVLGAWGIAAPIFDRDGQVVAACMVGGPTDRIRPRAREFAAEVKAAVRTISGLLGYRGPSDVRPEGAPTTGGRSRDGSPSRRSRR